MIFPQGLASIYLDNILPGRWMGSRKTTHCSARLPDLHPLDIVPLESFKRSGVRRKTANLQEINIIRHEIQPYRLQNAFCNFCDKLDYRQTPDLPFKHLIWRKDLLK